MGFVFPSTAGLFAGYQGTQGCVLQGARLYGLCFDSRGLTDSGETVLPWVRLKHVALVGKPASPGPTSPAASFAAFSYTPGHHAPALVCPRPGTTPLGAAPPFQSRLKLFRVASPKPDSSTFPVSHLLPRFPLLFLSHLTLTNPGAPPCGPACQAVPPLLGNCE